jgi:glycosyltransferase involved in cell wall biosynthesis
MRGGAELLLDKLSQAVQACGHDVERIRIPFNPSSQETIPHALDFAQSLDCSRWVAPPDLVLSLRFPAYLVPHPNQRVWLLHQHRQYYEYFGSTREQSTDPEGCDKLRMRIVAADTAALSQARLLRTLSGRVAARLERDNGIKAAALYSPIPDGEAYYRGRFDRYIFVPSRLELHKRQWLIIEAMRSVRSDMKVIIVGDGGAYRHYQDLVTRYQLTERILVMPFVRQHQMAAYYANCSAVFFGPEDEDYGYISLEAMASGKPVITCTDSGGPLEFIRHESNGLVLEPDPLAIAAAIDQIADRPDTLREWGATGRDQYEVLDLSWEKTAETLLK